MVWCEGFSTSVPWFKEEEGKFHGPRESKDTRCDASLKGYLLFGPRSALVGDPLAMRKQFF